VDAATLTVGGTVFSTPVIASVAAAGLLGLLPDDRLPSARANATLARVVAAVEEMYVPDVTSVPRTRTECLAEVKAGIDRLIDELGEDAAGRLARAEGRSAVAKLLAVALDRRRHPERYRELDRVYGSEGGEGEAPRGGAAGRLAVRIRAEHVNEAYRLAWEFRLLTAPAVDEPRGRFIGGGPAESGLPGVRMSPTFEAVMRVGDERSIPALVYFFRHACRDDGDTQLLAAKRAYTLDVLESFRTAAALRAILECAEWAERQWTARKPVAMDDRVSIPQRWVTDLVSRSRPDARRWRGLVGAPGWSGLSPRQRELLDAARRSFSRE
jgi:hypothetical protein